MLPSTATKTEIVTVAYDSFVSARHFTSSVGSMVTGIIVKSAHDHSVLCGLAFLSIYRNLCVTLAVSSLGTNLSTSLLVSGVSCQSPGCRRNQILLKLCYLCRQQQPPCGETATPSRTQSIYHNLLQEGCGADGHCCRAWRSQKVCPLFLILLLSWRPEKDSKNEK